MTQPALNATQAQRLLDHVVKSLERLDDTTAERVLDEFVDRLRHLDDLATVRERIVQTDNAGLKPLGGVDGAKALILLVERFRLTPELPPIHDSAPTTANGPA